MAYRSIKAGSTSQILQVFIADSSSTTGAGLTGLAYNSAGLTAYYRRQGAGNTGGTSVSLVTATRGTFASGGFVEIDATNMPGWYEFHVPDAAVAASAKSVAIHLKGATNMAPLPFLIELTASEPNDYSEVWSQSAGTKAGGLTFSQLVRAAAYTLLGKTSGMGTTSAVIRNLDDSGDAITGTVDSNGNRSTITITTAQL